MEGGCVLAEVPELEFTRGRIRIVSNLILLEIVMMINNGQTDLLKLVGPHGSLPVPLDDEITLKLAMLYEGECEGLGASKAARKFGYSVGRYFQLLHLYQEGGAFALRSRPTGPKRCYRRTEDVARLVIQHRFQHPEDPADFIAVTLAEAGHKVSTRSVERILAEYGLQKRSLHHPLKQGMSPEEDSAGKPGGASLDLAHLDAPGVSPMLLGVSDLQAGSLAGSPPDSSGHA